VPQPDDSMRLTDLESRYAYLEKTISDLNEVVFEQQKMLDSLRTRMKQYEQTTDRLAAALEGPRSANEERPPHY